MRSCAASDSPWVEALQPVALALFVSTVFWIAVTLARPAPAARAEKVAEANNTTRATSALVRTSPLDTRGDTFIVSSAVVKGRPISRAAARPSRRSVVAFEDEAGEVLLAAGNSDRECKPSDVEPGGP